MEGYISEIRMFAASFAPRNWAYCQGQILSIAQNTALFSLLGTTYGGNGVQTFGLPNFSSRTAVGVGQGAGLSYITLGQLDGVETVTLNTNQIPSHIHTGAGSVSPRALNAGGDETNPQGAFIGSITGQNLYAATHNVLMGSVSTPLTVGIAGGSAPHYNIQPSLGMNYIICLYGIFPSRN